MSKKFVAYGKGLTSGRTSKSAQTALDDLKVRGYENTVGNRFVDETNEEYLRRCVKGLSGADVMILLPGWEDVHPAIVLAQTAALLRLDVVEYVKPGADLKALTEADVIAPLLPGAGVIAPDSNNSELPHEEAARIVLGPRGAYYDSPLPNFERTGLIWSGVLFSKLKDGERITPEDVALCMVGVKLSREAFRHKRDNIVDAHGYLLTYQMVLDEKARTDAEGN